MEIVYSISSNYVNYNTTPAVVPISPSCKGGRPRNSGEMPAKLMQVPFTAAPASIRTQLTTKEEKEQYNTLLRSADKRSRKALETMLKNGTLLNADSNDNSTVLANLHKIASAPRAPGLKNDVILRDTI
ncbi:MAG: hypothetical protein LBJ74_00905, partial [Heliobacteriaceae bacterium]|nr:hypothetical protein [Heliobacteriaceae bacterium]